MRVSNPSVVGLDGDRDERVCKTRGFAFRDSRFGIWLIQATGCLESCRLIRTPFLVLKRNLLNSWPSG